MGVGTMNVKQAHAEATAEVTEYLAATPIEGIAWDMAEQIAKRRGWGWCTSQVSGKGWAIMVLTLDKITGEKI